MSLAESLLHVTINKLLSDHIGVLRWAQSLTGDRTGRCWKAGRRTEWENGDQILTLLRLGEVEAGCTWNLGG